MDREGLKKEAAKLRLEQLLGKDKSVKHIS